MRKITIKQYATLCNISVVAAHKRIKVWENNKKKYPEIKGIERLANNFFMLKINTNKDFKNNSKIILK
jgi:hypothetical protein